MKQNKQVSDTVVFKTLDLKAVDAACNTWASYFDAVKKSDKNYLGELPVRYRLKADCGEERVCFIIGTVVGDKLKEYGAIGLAFAVTHGSKVKVVTSVHLRNLRILGATTANYHAFQFQSAKGTHLLCDALDQLYKRKSGDLDEVYQNLSRFDIFSPKTSDA